jgi:rhodanese-related sulfurtransferase
MNLEPGVEHAAGHITGAHSEPVDRLARRRRNLPDAVEIVAYCRGPFVVYADDEVRQLRTRCRKARRLEDGYPEWRRAGLAIQAGAEPHQGRN